MTWTPGSPPPPVPSYATGPRWHVTFYYCATGMEGTPDVADHGIVRAPTAELAVDLILKRDYAGKKESEWYRSCLKAVKVQPLRAKPAKRPAEDAMYWICYTTCYLGHRFAQPASITCISYDPHVLQGAVDAAKQALERSRAQGTFLRDLAPGHPVMSQIIDSVDAREQQAQRDYAACVRRFSYAEAVINDHPVRNVKIVKTFAQAKAYTQAGAKVADE